LPWNANAQTGFRPDEGSRYRTFTVRGMTRQSGSPEVSAAAAAHVAAFRMALRSFLRTSERIARANGLTPQRHMLLLMIKGAPDGSESSTVTELAESLQLAQSTVTELVQRAEDAGLIKRERSDEDARVARLRLTAEGDRRLTQVFRSHDAERETLRRMLAELERATAPD
jgi:DNA-binding MarR family transcriptional regulator